jgi:hypothetical protein
MSVNVRVLSWATAPGKQAVATCVDKNAYLRAL